MNRFKKIFIAVLICCVFFVNGCYSYFLIPNNEKQLESELEKVMTSKRDDQKKVVFLGFLEYYLASAIVLPSSFAKAICYFKSTKYINLKCLPNDEICKATVAKWAQEKKYANSFQIAKNHNLCAMPSFSISMSRFFFDEFQKGKTDPKIIDSENEKFRKFADLYFEEYGNQSVKDFARIFELTEDGKIMNLRADADYYVIGKFLPVERELTWLGYLTYYSTIIPYVLTLGMIPSIEHNKITPSYYIFDKDFNQIAAYHYRSEYWLVSTVWPLDSKYPVKPDAWQVPENVILNFTPSVLEFKKELAKFCEVNKC
ncbi:MAG TPA: hypothetical protein PKV80_20255 [Leptospiraceae bacterium]|nr:hypothetical protein [Leptospiraceae bacterium]HNM06079.1 hypothetical protein [Leptospiraceae bacterium]HNO23660.1 hypothetical protein [Leptospiraceae bacterium]